MAWFTDAAASEPNEFAAGTVEIKAGGSLAVSDVIGERECKIIEEDSFPAFVVDYDQGIRKNRTPVLPERSNPSAVLQEEDGFFSLGFKGDGPPGGWITVKFERPIKQGEQIAVITVTEETGGKYPEEKAEVLVSQDGENWFSAGYASNKDNRSGNQSYTELALPEGLQWAQYVKIVDCTDRALHSGDADGYDVVSIKARNFLDCEVVNWNPGSCHKVNYFVRNAGTLDVFVRAKLEGKWYEQQEDGEWVEWGEVDENGEPLPSEAGVEFSLCKDEDMWDLRVEDGQYVAYYKGMLEGSYLGYGEGDDLCVRVCLNGPYTGNEYQGKRYILTATFEAIQASNGASQEVWGWSPDY